MYKQKLNLKNEVDLENTLKINNDEENKTNKNSKNLENLIPNIVDFISDQVTYWSQFGFIDKFSSVIDICSVLKTNLKEYEKEDNDSENETDNDKDDIYF